MLSLGFQFQFVDHYCRCGCNGKEAEIAKDKHCLTDKGNITKVAIRHLSNGKFENYRGFWGAVGEVVQKARVFDSEEVVKQTLSFLKSALCDRQRDVLSWRDAKSQHRKKPDDEIRRPKDKMLNDALMNQIRKDENDRMVVKDNSDAVLESRRRELDYDDEDHTTMLRSLFAAYNEIQRLRAVRLETMFEKMSVQAPSRV
mmetsp:Transcript_37521/g.94125  ORF Transcript_37521/g.94125 Transcript_37521/m.94125 type:complete len:200 (-) Transcript_37521:477-1076(-)